MSIVEVDGIYTEPTDADLIYITVAQRYSVLVKTKTDTATNYAFVGSMDQVCLTHGIWLFMLLIRSRTYLIRFPIH